MQKLLAIVDPWGDDRADLRAAVNTSMVVSSNDAEPTEDKAKEQIEGLRKYLLLHNPAKLFDEDPATLDAIAAAVAKRIEGDPKCLESAI